MGWCKGMTNKEEEEYFYKVQETYLATGEKEAWHQMFFIIQKCIKSAILKCLKRTQVKRDDLDDLVMDATLRLMQRYLRPQKHIVTHLLTSARFEALNVLYNPKQKFNDSVQRFSDEKTNDIDIEGDLEYGNDY